MEQKKTQLALLQEKKAENELELKRDKKFLLENFIKMRDENKQLLDMVNGTQGGNQEQYFPTIGEYGNDTQNYNEGQIINENEFEI